MKNPLKDFLPLADNATLAQQCFVALQYLVPQQLLSRAAGFLAETEIPAIKNYLIAAFIRRFRVNMNEAALQDYKHYKNFNSFFTRALVAGARPVCAEGVACPADGTISQLGTVSHGRIFQAKGQHYTTWELLGGDRDLAHLFDDGLFATVYLSPRDYHRVHMPVAGRLLRTIYVPGELFSVNNTTAENVPRLFARNERLVTVFATEYGEMALVLVGAMIVAGIETVWDGQVAPARRRVHSRDYSALPAAVALDKGAEMGRFKLGSTAIVLFRKDSGIRWQAQPGDTVRMGQLLASQGAG